MDFLGGNLPRASGATIRRWSGPSWVAVLAPCSHVDACTGLFAWALPGGRWCWFETGSRPGPRKAAHRRSWRRAREDVRPRCGDGQTSMEGQSGRPRDAMITGGVVFTAGVYGPVSSLEEGTATIPGYECCSVPGQSRRAGCGNRGPLWKTFTIADVPRRTTRNSEGTNSGDLPGRRSGRHLHSIPIGIVCM